MGASQSAQEFDSLKRVVIVGASFACQIITKQLLKLDPNGKKFDILQIDKNEYFEFLCSNYKQLTDDSAFDHMTIMNDEAVKSYGSDNVKFKQAKLINVRSASDQIEVELPNGNTEVIGYDALVLATGGQYVAPWRGEDSKLQTLEDRRNEVTLVREEISRAKSILCVGAGTTGIEAAVWLKEAHPDKEVAICQRGATLVPMVPGAHVIAKQQFEDAGVKVLTGVTYSDDAPIAKEYDYKLDCRGFKYTGPNKFMTERGLMECVEPTTGQIMVDEHLNATSKHPFFADKDTIGIVRNKIFSFGDVCLTSMNEDKSIPSMYQYVNVLANNIEVAVGGQGDMKTLPQRLNILTAIPVGTKAGISQINNMVNADPGAVQMKNDITDNNMGALRGIPEFTEKINASRGEVNFMFGVLESSICCCLPVHISKGAEQHEVDLKKTADWMRTGFEARGKKLESQYLRD